MKSSYSEKHYRIGFLILGLAICISARLYGADTLGFGPPSLVSGDPSTSLIDNEIATDGHGTWIFAIQAWHCAGFDVDLFLARSTDDGGTWTTYTIPNSITGETSGLIHPEVFTNCKGVWIIAFQLWTSQDQTDPCFPLAGGQPLSGALKPVNIACVVSFDNGLTWQNHLTYLTMDLPPSDPEMVPELTANLYPRIGFDGNGNPIAVWSKNRFVLGTSPWSRSAFLLDVGADAMFCVRYT